MIKKGIFSKELFHYLNKKKVTEWINEGLELHNIENLINKFNILKYNDLDVYDINVYINSENECQKLIKK